MTSGPLLQPSAEVERLHGREAELAALVGLVTGPARSAVLLGSPGEGKTALLSALARRLRGEGWSVLVVSGRVADRAVPLAGLTELLLLARSPTSSLASELRMRLLDHARGERGVASVLGLRLDVLTWLEELAGDGRLLVCVDDAQWLDPTTLQVLTFLAHRVAGGPVSVVLAARTERPRAELQGLPVLALRPIDDQDARRVVADVRVDLPEQAVRALVARAAGNPLALVELARSGPEALLAEDAETGVPERLEQAFAADLATLPAATRQVVVLASAGAEDMAVLARSSPGADVVDALEPAERVGLVRVRGQEVRFRHPLARQAVYAGATAAERARAHRALAAAYHDDADRRAWHRAASAVGPDEAVAAELAAAAARATDRVAYAEAARALRRAVELTPDPAVRERRVVELLQVGTPTGQLTEQVGLARRVRDETADPAVRAAAQQFIASTLSRTMDQQAARLALEDAVAQAAVLDPVAAWASLTSLASLVYQTAADPTVTLGWVEKLGRAEDEHPLVTASRVWVRAAAEPARRPPDLLEEVARAAPLPPPVPPVVVGLRAMLLGAAAWLLDLPDLAAAHLREARRVLERENSQELVPILVALAQVGLDATALDDAEEAARLLLELSEVGALDYQRAVAQHALAAVAALRGEREEARDLAAQVWSRLDLASCTALEIGVRAAVADSWYGQDDEARWDQLRACFDLDGAPRHGRLSVRALVPAVSAALGTDRAADARRLVDGVRRALAEPPEGAYQTMVLAAAEALLADDPEVDTRARRVVDDPRHARWPLELADARLAYGRWLRRRRRFPEARVQLLGALQAFERIGARLRVEAAREELGRVGGTSSSSADAATWSSLTGRERQVVRLAATGLTNREIGEAVFLSPRTVGVHLYNAFPKLGVTARHQLAAVVARLDR
ncbi:helix-turn-helix transcriptional regulator [Microlunatus flavus]|uniref:helix-turn-helix transcriptional regulator n=1 Tax=Microlunatus flavus TaxID=1036181 RepID=UPI0011146505|nr:LuxR C-terminal-related transcriptional regulator [Microlunatus flavus]